MTTRRAIVLALMAVCLGGTAIAQDEELPLTNWGAPPYWTPSIQLKATGFSETEIIPRSEGMQAHAEALPSSPLPFVAIQPCRIVDTRVALDDGFHRPNLGDDEARTFNLPASPDCTGLPVTAGAWSLNIQFRPITQLSFLTAYPTGTTMPGVSTMTASPTAWVQNAAIVPAGTGGAIDIYCQYAGRVVIDINGYYGPQSVVTSLTGGESTLTGDVTLAEGSNVMITSFKNTLRIAATGGPGGVLPIGTTGQTLYHSGTAWTASSVLTNDGSASVGINGSLNLPATGSASIGVVTVGGSPFIHSYAGPDSLGRNVFVGEAAGNFTMGCAPDCTSWPFLGSYNIAIGYRSLSADTSGYANTANGYDSLYSNTTGFNNTASGHKSLFSNVTGSDNTASGALGLYVNTTGSSNIAVGYRAGYNLTTGSYNIDIGNEGAPDEDGTIRIGDSNQTRTFIAGIRGVTTGVADAIPVVIDSTGQLGTVSSSMRFKQDVADMGEASSRLMDLRPVTFRYKAHAEGPLRYGLIAEEVERVMPDLVLKDATGRPETVAYQELPAMLLNELKRQQATIKAQQGEIAALQARLRERDRDLERRLAALEQRTR